MPAPRARDRPSTRLLVLLCAALIAIGATTAFLLAMWHRDGREHAEDQILQVARAKVRDIHSWRQERLANATDVGFSHTFGAAVNEWLSTQNPALGELILSTLKLHAGLYGYVEAHLVSVTGEPLLSSVPAPGLLSQEEAAAVLEASFMGRSILTDLHADRDTGIIHLSTVAPVIHARGMAQGDTRAAAYVVFIADARDTIFPFIQDWPVPSETAETLLVRRDGGDVLFLNELRHQSATALKLRQPLADHSLPAAMVVHGRRGLVEGADYRGVEVIAALQEIPHSPWYLVAKMDRAEALGSVTSTILLAAGLMAAVLLGLVGAVAYFWQRNLKHQYVTAYEAERARRELTERFEHLVKSAAEIIVLADEGLRIIDANALAVEAYGYSREELLGLSLGSLAAPDEREFFDRQMETMASQGSSVYETTAARKDGSVFPVDVSNRLFTVDGKSYVQAIIRDATGRKKVENDLLAGRERYRATVEAVAQIVWTTGASGEVVEPLTTLEEYAGFTFQTLKEKGLWAAVHPEDARRVETAWANALAKRSRFEVECRMLRKDGVYRDFWIRGVPVMSAEGVVTEWVGACADITDRKRTEAERIELEKRLQHSQRLESLGVLAGGIAHDFNNILTAVLGHADLALADLPLSSPARQDVQEIILAARKASELCRQMLAYSGRGQFIVEEVDLTLLVEEMVHVLKTALSKKIILNLQLARALPPIRADVSQINQIIMNLVMNAAEAIGERSGVIGVSVGAQECGDDYLGVTYLREDLPSGLYIWLEVSDTGTGMDRETMSRLFEPFFTTKFTGRGLGLAAVLGIVRGHKGALKVYSEPGKGSTFKVLLPAVEEALDRPFVTREARQSDWAGHGIVLLADDEETVRALGRRMLERLGFEVLQASDGEEAVRVFAQRREEIALVILDLTMPRKSGEDAYREIRALSPEARVIISSGYTESSLVSRFAGKGMAGFLPKPYTADMLAQKIRNALQGEPNERRNG